MGKGSRFDDQILKENSADHFRHDFYKQLTINYIFIILSCCNNILTDEFMILIVFGTAFLSFLGKKGTLMLKKVKYCPELLILCLVRSKYL